MEINLQYCWTTSWGVSTRFIGAIIMTHGDDQGLVLPPKLAPIQIVIVPIYRSDEEREIVMPVVEKIAQALNNFRLKVDTRTEVTPGFKLRLGNTRCSLAKRLVPGTWKKGQFALARRDIPGKEGKSFVPREEYIKSQVAEMLITIQAALYDRAKNFRDDHIFDPSDYSEFQEVVQNGWAFSWWCGNADCENKIKTDTKATTRCIPLDQPKGKGKCIVCGEDAHEKVYFSKAY